MTAQETRRIVSNMTNATVSEDEIALAIAHNFRSRRGDGAMTFAEYAYGIVNGRAAHVRWQDGMMARERIAAGLDMRAIGKAVAIYRAQKVCGVRP